MRISDWSSDVCSSDLIDSIGKRLGAAGPIAQSGGRHDCLPKRLLPFSVRDNRADSARLMQAAPFINIGLEHDPQHLLARPGGISRSDPGSLRRGGAIDPARRNRSEEHTSELQSLMRISYAVFCLKKKK